MGSGFRVWGCIRVPVRVTTRVTTSEGSIWAAIRLL